MKKIDAHMHICETIAGYCRRGELRAIGEGRAQWANGDIMELIPKGYGETNFTAEAALRVMDENDVEAGVILQGSMYGFQNNYIQRVLQQYPTRFKGACTVDPFAKNALETLDAMLHWTRIVKFEVSSGGGLMGVHFDFTLDGPMMMPIFDLICKRGATIVIDFGDYTMASHQPAAIRRVALQYPAMPIVMCHLLAPLPGHLDMVEPEWKMLALPNLWFDISALPKIAAPEAYPYPSCALALKAAKGILGAERMMFGTDMPMALTSASYAQISDYIAESGIFSDAELDAVFYQTAKEVYCT